MNEVFSVANVSNREFLEQHAEAGRVGLVGGETLVDKAIRHAERHVDAARQTSRWSHALVFEGRRIDGEHWVIESDIHLARKHLRLGAQENRIEKYFDEATFSSLAVLDFGLSGPQVRTLLREGLELVAGRARYSLRELVGTLVALRDPGRRQQPNALAREGAFYCSAFVRHLFHKIGVELAPGLDPKHTTPEDLARSPAPHTTFLLERASPLSRLRRAANRLRRGTRKIRGSIRAAVRAGA
jgi:hypothetical protein